MSLGEIALEHIARAAIRADGFAGLHDVEKDARMLAPQRRVWRWAVQWQIVYGNFDGGYVGHNDLPVWLVVVRRLVKYGL